MTRKPWVCLLWATVGSVFMLTAGCWQEFDSGLKQSADSLASRDAVTGVRTANFVSEADEIKVAENACKSILEDFGKKNAAVDKDEALMAKLREMMGRIAKVSHRPSLPWEIHLVDVAENNAFTVGGGKVVVYKGLIGGLAQDDDELAVIIAHEAAHVACRHVSKTMTWDKLGPVVSKSTKSPIFSGSFTTRQEDEADRVGLLYAALAGYDPASAVRIWKRADTKYGSSPGDYSYDHEINRVRAEKVAALVPAATKYYVPGKLNPNYEALRTDNELTPKAKAPQDQNESGLAAVTEAGTTTYADYIKTKNEQQQREAAKAIAIAKIVAGNVRVVPQANGKMIIGFTIFNNHETPVTVTVKVSLQGGAKKDLWANNFQAGPVPRQKVTEYSVEVPSVTGAQAAKVKVVEVAPQ